MKKFTWLSENQERQMKEYRRDNAHIFQINTEQEEPTQASSIGHRDPLINPVITSPPQPSGHKSAFRRVIPIHSQPSGLKSPITRVYPYLPPVQAQEQVMYNPYPPTGHKSAFHRVIPSVILPPLPSPPPSRPTQHKSAFRRVSYYPPR
ncbi:hypothetical protein K501DRAFT_306537 [Backusella circina FSU 941]|nr:hypothetical protein K501DRAFT_306537 [Backusella circina FSU 941]